MFNKIKDMINAEAHLEKAEEMSEIGDFKEAVLELNKAIVLNPKNFKAYNNRGHAYFCLEKDDLAKQDYDTAIELNPKAHLAYCNRAKLYRIAYNDPLID